MKNPSKWDSDPPNQLENCDLISEFDQVPNDAIKTHSDVYWKLGGVKKNQRAAKNNEMMSTYILASQTTTRD